MGSKFVITVVDQEEAKATQYVQMAISEIKRIERVISSWDSNSETHQININAGIQPVKVSNELFQLIKRSIQISKITDGAFDISYASMDKIWKFDGSMQQMPSSEAIKKSIAKIGFQNIVLDEATRTVFLKKKGMKIGFGAIGKGYAADMAKTLLVSKGAKSGVINASGDLISWGTKENGSPWKVGIVNPFNKEKIFSWFKLDDRAVVTSGNYEKFVVFNGKKYTHIIDPRSGYPVTGIHSVTIVAPKAELADALSTSVFVMGKETGLYLIDQLKGIECLIVDDKGKLWKSSGLKTKNNE
ncbi:FAD:protein FMN transferase [Prolixibacteraceae bacterium JC049]|nr:FAD:protein FMN transferase [Prolixibacteraceae bacterium JC049]